MKHLFTTLLLTIASIACTAQIEQFTFAVSANASFSKLNGEAFDGSAILKQTSRTINLQPKVGFFALKRLCVGAYVPLMWSRSESQGLFTYDGSSRSTGLGPFVRYYQPLAKNLYGILGLSYSWNKQFIEYETLDPYSGDSWHTEGETKTVEFQQSLGLSYFINRNIAIEMMLDHLKKENNDSDPVAIDTFQNSLTLSFGLQIYLTKNRE